MHTDEYEISVGREITHCRKLIKCLKNAILDRERKYGMSTETFLEAFRSNPQEMNAPDFVKWHEDQSELRKWLQVLGEYEEAYRSLKEI